MTCEPACGQSGQACCPGGTPCKSPTDVCKSGRCTNACPALPKPTLGGLLPSLPAPGDWSAWFAADPCSFFVLGAGAGWSAVAGASGYKVHSYTFPGFNNIATLVLPASRTDFSYFGSGYPAPVNHALCNVHCQFFGVAAFNSCGQEGAEERSVICLAN